MRISTSQVYARGLAGITNASSQLTRTQEQIASGVKFQTAADDPVAAARISQVETELGLSEQFRRNIDNVDSRLQLAEVQITTAQRSIDRIRDLVIEAGNGALSNENREQIALEINRRLEELVGIVNSRDSSGDFLFSGFKTNTKPFEATGDGFIYQGDEGVRFQQVASSLNIASNETGKDLFANIPVANRTVVASVSAANTSLADVSLGRVVDRAVFEAATPDDYVITFNDLSDIAPAGPNYTVTRRSNGQVVTANEPFSISTPIAIFGVEVEFDGVLNPGDTVVVEQASKQNLLTTVARIGEGLATFVDNVDRASFLDDALINLDNIQESLLNGRSRIAARLNTLDTARSSQESLDLINNSLLSDLRDLDYAEAISRLSFQSFVLEAAQQSFVKISGLSLFDFIR